MKNIKIWFTAFALFTVVWFSSIGCVTKQVWTERTKGKAYDETIVAFYTNFEKKEIIFIGEKYHYIFNRNTSDFIDMLRAKSLLKLSQKDMQINSHTDLKDNRKVETSIFIKFDNKNLNSDQENWLKSHHFKMIKESYQENNQIVEHIVYHNIYNIEGTRYLATEEINNKVQTIKPPLKTVVIEQYIDKKSTLYKVAMTPLSVTADAALVVVGVGAAIIYAPFALTYVAYENISK